MRKQKKGLAILLCVAMVIGMMPGTGALQAFAAEDAPEQTEGKLISAWQWNDEEGYLDEETGSLALPGASEEMPAYFDDVTAFLPTQIQASVEDAEDTEAEAVDEIIILGDWSCAGYPEEGAYSGSYIFAAALPEGYALSAEAEALEIIVELGGAQMYNTVTGYVNGFCTDYAADSSCSTHTSCNGYQPAEVVSASHHSELNGAFSGYYAIENAGQLYWFAAKVNGGNGGINAVLTDHITVNENVLDAEGNIVSGTSSFRSWTPIGNNSKPTQQYTGTFDGNNHTISGLYYNDTDTSTGLRVGLFGYVGAGGKVSNVVVADSYINAYYYVGGVCGYSNGTITNCTNTGTVSGTGYYVGGVCGYNSGGTITNCTNRGSVSRSGQYVGGVCGGNGGQITSCSNSGEVSGSGIRVGGVCGSNGGQITSCSNSGKVSGSGNIVGGVCGGNNSDGQITSCTNSGEVSGSGQCVGGVCGLVEGPITNSSNSGTVKGDSNIGGVCGENRSKITNCYNAGTVSGSSSVGGVCGYHYNGKIVNCYSDSDKYNGNAVGGCYSNYDSATVLNKTTDAFQSGEVAYLLSQGCTVDNTTYDGSIWGQKLGDEGDAYPVLKKTGDEGNTVYQIASYPGCVGNPGTPSYTYSNTKENYYVPHSYQMSPDGTYHECTVGREKIYHSDVATFTADDTVHSITGNCSECGNLGTVTLSAPTGDLTYDGSAKKATVTGSISGITSPAVTYQTADGQTDLGTNAPKNAGTYTASITLGTATASVNYTIQQATPDLGTVSVTPLNDTLAVSAVEFSRTNTTVAGAFALKDVTELQYGTHDYTYVFTPGDTVNYKSVTGTVSITVNDTIAPTVSVKIKTNVLKSVLNSATFGYFFKEAQYIDIETSDSGTGVAGTWYYVSDQPLNQDAVSGLEKNKWVSYDSSNKPSLNKGKYYVYVKVTDTAANTTYAGTDGIVIYEDSAPAAASIEYTYKENSDKTIAVSLNDNTVAAIKDKDGNALTKDTDYSVTADGTITITKSYLDGLDASDTPYTLTVSYNPQGASYTENKEESSGNDLNDAPAETVISITVKKVSLAVTKATTTDRAYDGTKEVAVTSVILDGVKSGDDVSVDTTSLKGTLTSGNAGEYTSVTLPTLTLTGTAAGNYTLVQPTEAVTASGTITISRKFISIQSAVIDDVIYRKDGSYDLKVSNVGFDGVVTGETLTLGTDYTVTAQLTGTNAIADNVAATVTVALTNGNYTLGSATFNTTVKILPHQHNWSYAAQGAVITATCSADYCTVENNTAVITVKAPAAEELIYSGEAKAATLAGSVDGVDAPAIAYNTTDENAPVNAGTYTASITLGTATAKVEYTITQATPDLGTVSVTPLKDTLAVSDVVINRTNSAVAGSFALEEGTTLQYGTNNCNYVFTPTDTVNYKSVTGTVSIMVNDTIAPTAQYQIGANGWKEFVNTISFGLFCKEYKTVGITYSDNGSGVKTKQYYIANKELTQAEITALVWNDYSDTISLDAQGVYFIYVKVEDNAGNTVVLNSEGIVIYAESTLSPTSMDYTYKENADREVQITLKGNTFGKLTDASGNEIESSNYSIDEAGKLTLRAAYLDTLKVGEHTYKVYMNPQGQVTDKVTLEYSFSINVKAQELTVTGATATDRVYDTTNVVAITAMTLSGVKSGDTVSVDTTNLTGTLTSANAGNYTSVTLPELTLTGTDAGNYTLVQPTGAVPTSVTISKANAAITVGTETYNKTFGDAAFSLDVTDTNMDEAVQYAVTTGADVISVSAEGTVTILKAGTAKITVSLPASTNYNAAAPKTITVNVAKKTGYTVDTINKTYAYKKGNKDTIDLSKLLPSDCGSVTYGTPQVTGALYTEDGAPAVSDGKLSYTVTEGDTDKTGTITVTVSSENYADFTITVNITLKGRIPVKIDAIGITDKTDSGANVYLGAIDEGEYGIDNYYLYYTIEPETNVTAETVKAKGTASPTGTFVLSGLPEDTTYYLYAIAVDTYGNASAVWADRFTTWVKAPEISPAGGSHVGSVSVSLSAGDGTTIYYTTDGSEPTTESTEYTQAFTLTASATVKAIAVKGNNGSVTTQAQFTITTGGLPTTSADNVTQAGDSTTADLTGNTVSKGGETTTTVDQTTADKIVDKAIDNNSEEVVINAETKNSSAASSTKSAEVTLPAETLGAIAEKTDADVVIKTDVAEVKLDNKATEAIASQAQAEAGTTGNAETVSIIAEKVKEGAKEVRYELKVVTSGGKVISDFNGGSVSVTVNVPKSLSGKNLVCVYIDDNGLMHKVEGQKNADGTYTFTTGHFSTYAILAEEEADAAIAEQIEAINSIQIKLSTKVANTKTGKKGIKLTWKADTDIQLDGIEVFRSVKSKSGYKKIYTTKKAKNAGYYINTKSLKKNTKYYYKVRGFVTIDGQKVYTAWSNKGIRTFR